MDEVHSLQIEREVLRIGMIIPVSYNFYLSFSQAKNPKSNRGTREWTKLSPWDMVIVGAQIHSLKAKPI